MGLTAKQSLPENVIVVGDFDSCLAQAKSVIAKEKTCHPEWFEGTKDSFVFELRYTEPFDKNFRELKRLQGTAADTAGRRADFKGYIIIDLNAWLTHHDEDYLNIALLFLTDMNDCWKYVFLVSDQSEKAAKDLVGKVMTVFFQNSIPCKIVEGMADRTEGRRVDLICGKLGVDCSLNVRSAFTDFVKNGFGEAVVTALISEVSWSGGNRITLSALMDYISKGESSIRYMLSQKEYNRFINLVEQRKECWYGEREAI